MTTMSAIEGACESKINNDGMDFEEFIGEESTAKYSLAK